MQTRMDWIPYGQFGLVALRTRRMARVAGSEGVGGGAQTGLRVITSTHRAENFQTFQNRAPEA